MNLRNTPKNTTSRAIGYVRVSTAGQVTDGVSIDAQAEKIRQYAALFDFELVDIIEDAGESASTLDRPGLRDALGRLKRGEADTLIVVKLDRLTRSVGDLATLLERHFTNAANLVSVGEQVNTGTAAGRLVLNVLISVAQWEREAIGERTRAALQFKKSKGELVGAVPYGYDLATDGVHLVENLAEREVVCAIMEYQAAGLSLRAIAGRLAERGFTSRTGSAFHPQTVSNIVNAQEARAA